MAEGWHTYHRKDNRALQQHFRPIFPLRLQIRLNKRRGIGATACDCLGNPMHV